MKVRCRFVPKSFAHPLTAKITVMEPNPYEAPREAGYATQNPKPLVEMSIGEYLLVAAVSAALTLVVMAHLLALSALCMPDLWGR